MFIIVHRKECLYNNDHSKDVFDTSFFMKLIKHGDIKAKILGFLICSGCKLTLHHINEKNERKNRDKLRKQYRKNQRLVMRVKAECPSKKL